jgi:hypothetical protein
MEEDINYKIEEYLTSLREGYEFYKKFRENLKKPECYNESELEKLAKEEICSIIKFREWYSKYKKDL